MSGQDWADWLRHAHHEHPPLRQPLSPADAEPAWTALVHLARREGFAVERGNCAAADGFTTWRTRTIRIRPDATTAQAVIALAHQLGHVLLHSQIARHEPSGTIPCTGIRQVEADSVAYLTAAHLGLDAPVAFPHVASWAGTDPRARPATTIQAVTTSVLSAADTITTHLDAAGVTGHEHKLSGPVPARFHAVPPAASAHAEGLPLPGESAEPPAPLSEVVGVLDNAAQFFRSQMPGSWVPGYLASRGLSAAAGDPWQAGYAPDSWDALTRHLQAAGYTDTILEAAGVAHRSRRGTLIDTFRDRAILPIRSPDGTIIAFIGRAADHADPGTPKYLNSPATSLYDKSAVLFGLREASDALARGARPVIVEGPLDAIAVTLAGQGRYAGVAPCGTALTARQAAALAQAADLRAGGVSVAFDPDDAGRRAAVRAYHILVPHTERLAAVTLPAGQDPAKILADSGPGTLAQMLARRARPLPDLVVNAEIRPWARRLRDPEGQIGALRAAAPLIAAMPPAHVARQVARLAAILRLDHATVTEAVTTALDELAAGSAPHGSAMGAPPTAIRTARRDSPRSSPEIGRTAATPLATAPGKRASIDRPRLARGPVRR